MLIAAPRRYERLLNDPDQFDRWVGASYPEISVAFVPRGTFWVGGEGL